MKTITILILSFNLFFLNAQHDVNKFDFSGMEIFWKIVDYLEQDKDAPEELWEELSQNPGIRAAEDIEFGKNYFKKFYEMAFMPSKSEKCKARIEKGGFFGPYLEHMLKIKDHKDELKALQMKLTQSPELYSSAIQSCKMYLPEGVFEGIDLPVVSFIVFGPDGRGYKPILIDPLYFIEEVYDKKDFLAHEFHHHYIDQHMIFRDGEEILNWIFGQVYKEGIADCINIPKEIFKDTTNNSKRANKYRKLYDQSADIIAKVDSVLNLMYNNKEQFYENAKFVRKSIPMAGHTLGYFISKTLLDYTNKDILLKDFGNPYEFILRYNEIALKNDLPSFSENSVKLLLELNEKYG